MGVSLQKVRNGLVVAALGLSGCAVTLQDLRDSARCVENTSFDVTINEVYVHFAPDHYSIDFPRREFFLHWPSSSGDSLNIPLLGLSFHDFDSNGALDAVYHSSGNFLELNERQQQFYNQELSELRKNEVQHVWERCRNRLRRQHIPAL